MAGGLVSSSCTSAGLRVHVNEVHDLAKAAGTRQDDLTVEVDLQG